MFFSENLKYLRKHKNGGQSQENLAESLGLTRATIMAYESGRAEPRLAVLNKIALYFDISLEELINVHLAKRNQPELKSEDAEQEEKEEEEAERKINPILGVWIVMAS